MNLTFLIFFDRFGGWEPAGGGCGGGAVAMKSWASCTEGEDVVLEDGGGGVLFPDPLPFPAIAPPELPTPLLLPLLELSFPIPERTGKTLLC